MADSILESNLILNTKTTKPDLSGFDAVHKRLLDIDKQLGKLTAKPWTIKLTLDDKALKAYGLQQKGTAAKSSPAQVAMAPQSTAQQSFYSGNFPGGQQSGRPISGPFQYKSTTRSYSVDEETGKIKVATTELDKQAAISQRIETVQTRITDEHGKQIKDVDAYTNLQQKVIMADQKRLAMETEIRREKERQARLAHEGRTMVQERRAYIASGLAPPSMGGLSAEYAFPRIAASERAALARRKEQEAQDLASTTAMMSGARATDKKNASAEMAQKQKIDRMAARQHLSDTQAELKQKQELDRAEARNHLRATQAEQAIQQKAEREDMAERSKIEQRNRRAELNTQQGRDAREAKQHLRDFNTTAKQQGVQAAVADATSKGYSVRSRTTIKDVLTGKVSEEIQMVKYAGNAFTGLRAHVMNYSEAAGKAKDKTIGHTEAIKLMGDTLAGSASKVLNWTIATAAVFAVIGALTMASKAVVELEQNTVLLARVGRKLGDDFSERIVSARDLTKSIVDLTTVYGGNAAAATRAATVFARAGRDQKEILEGVRVSLLAAKIAELDVEDAAVLISSAMLQFNLKARDLAPTLDTLNTLSNNYRVSTNDLLQAISRGGSVYADHNGRLSEMAALTALVSQETSRSGAEIGNAFKTIISQLDRLDIQQELFDQLGISTVNFAGESRSLVSILQEEALALEKLSDSERKQITLKQAGIRQRGLLVASLKNAPQALVARNQASMAESSAELEFREGANVTSERLSRLQAEFVKLAQNASGPLRELAAGLISIANNTLKVLNIFDGWAVSTVALVGGLFAMRYAILYIVNSLIQMAVQMGITAAASLTLNVALLNFTAVAATAAVAIYAVVVANTDYAAAARDAGAAIDSNISIEKERRKNLDETTEAIYRLIAAKKQEASASKRNEISKQIDEYGRSISGGKPGDASLPANATKEQVAEFHKKRSQELINAQRSQITERIRLKKQELEETKNIDDEITYSESAKNAFKAFFSTDRNADENIRKDWYEKVGRPRIAKKKAEIAKVEAELEALRLEAASLKATEISPEKQERLLDLQGRLAGSDKTFQQRDREKAARDFVEGNTSSIAAKQAAYDSLSTSVSKLAKELDEAAEFSEQFGNDNFIEQQKQVNSLIEEQTKAYLNLVGAQRSAAGSRFAAAMGNEDRLRGGMRKIAVSHARGIDFRASSFGDALAGINAERQSQLDRIARNSIIANQNWGGEGVGLGAADATKKDTEEALLKLKDLEHDKVLAILEAEKDIAIERRKSADEALRAVGALSTEDKLRFRATAAYFKDNPNAMISVEQQMSMPAENLALIRNLFPGKLAPWDRDGQSGELVRRMERSGFGINQNIINGEREVAAARAGRTTQEMYNNTIDKGNDLDEKVQNLNGQDGEVLTDFLKKNAKDNRGFFGAGGESQAHEFNVEVNALNLDPLIDSFEKVVNVLMDEKIRVVADKVQAIVDQNLKHTQQTKPRRTFGST